MKMQTRILLIFILTILPTFSIASNDGTKKANTDNQYVNTTYINGFLTEVSRSLDRASRGRVNFENAEYFIENNLLPKEFDWESVFVLASHPAASPNVSVGRPTEVQFFKRAPAVYGLLSKIRNLDLSRTDLACVRESRDFPNREGHVSISMESLEKFPKTCDLVDVSLKGIFKYQDIEWLVSVRADVNAGGANLKLPGLLPAVVLTTIIQGEVHERKSYTINNVYRLKYVLDFDTEYSPRLSHLLTPGLKETLGSIGPMEFSDVLTSRIDFSSNNNLISAYCKIAAENLLAEYNPRFPVLRYFLESDKRFSLEVVRQTQTVTSGPCHTFIKKMLEDPEEYTELRNSALQSGNIEFIKAFDSIFK